MGFDAQRGTWKLVTMWPESSHTMPEPWPCGMRSTSMVKDCAFVNVLMFTTDGVFSRKTRIVFSSEGASLLSPAQGQRRTTLVRLVLPVPCCAAPIALRGSGFDEYPQGKPPLAATGPSPLFGPGCCRPVGTCERNRWARCTAPSAQRQPSQRRPTWRRRASPARHRSCTAEQTVRVWSTGGWPRIRRHAAADLAQTPLNPKEAVAVLELVATTQRLPTGWQRRPA